MKRLLSFLLLVFFAIAVCYAVPSHYGTDPPLGKVFAKKVLHLQVFEAPVSFEVPAAPRVIYDLIVPEGKQLSKVVIPQSNSPPITLLSPKGYSMSGWRLIN